MTDCKDRNFSKITDWCHAMIGSLAQKEGTYVDATMGNGNDTLFLARLAGERGRVFAFDVQKDALHRTKELLKEYEMTERVRLILDGHEHMDQYVEKESADVICFNFGYLPGGDHSIATEPETSVEAVAEGLRILKKGGVMSLCIYSGGDTGFEERESLLGFLKGLSPREYTVIAQEYYNRKNNPPIPVLVFKN